MNKYTSFKRYISSSSTNQFIMYGDEINNIFLLYFLRFPLFHAIFLILYLKKTFFLFLLLFLLPSSSFHRLRASTNARDENIFNDKIQIKNNKLKLKHRGTSLCSFSYLIKQKKNENKFLNKVFCFISKDKMGIIFIPYDEV